MTYPEDIDEAVVAFNACYYCGSVVHVAMNPEDCPHNNPPQIDWDALNDAYTKLHNILDAQGHDNDCVWRCLRNDCRIDHGCSMDEDYEEVR